jgi:hypothetical protein
MDVSNTENSYYMIWTQPERLRVTNAPYHFLIKSASTSMAGNKSIFRTGEAIPESGIYRVIHAAHRVPHEVTLLSGHDFPRCSKCKDSVQFELIQAATELLHEHGFRVQLYELPVEECENSECSKNKPII